MHRFNKLLLIAVLLPGLPAGARTSDAEQPIHIEADQVEIREQEGLSIYRGNVHITQGSLRINGDEIRIRSDDKGLQKFRVLGKPARFYQLNDQDEEVSAQGEEMEYQAKSGLLILNRNAVLVQRDNRFTSEHIIYNTQTSVVQAGPGKDTDSASPPRVSITIMPEKTPGSGEPASAPQEPENKQPE